jgi:hypothetical protein
MDRRRFLRGAGGLFTLLSSLPLLSGCADETKQTGTTVEMTPEDIAGFEAAEESYRAMEKGSRKTRKQ